MSNARELDKKKATPYEQHGAVAGMVKNAPHESIPKDSVAYLRNAHSFPTEFQPRLATRILDVPQPPALSGRTDYTASKTGDVITSNSGLIFGVEDVSNYWVWPGDPNYHDEIVEFVDEQHVRTRDSSAYPSTSGCWMHGKLNLNAFHETERKKFYQWGQEIYVCNDETMHAWTKALCVSRHQPSNVISDLSPMDEFAVIGNSNGIFKIDFEPETPILWKLNTAVPSVLPISNNRSVTNKYRYDYTYSMSRLSGTGIRDRTYSTAKILAESGTCVLNPNTSPPRDYGTKWTPRRIDTGIKTQGRLVGGTLAVAQQTVDYYRNTLGAGGGSFNLTINAVTAPFLIQFDIANYNVQSMDEIAMAIQDTIRNSFPFSTCQYDHDNTRFIITSGEEDGSTIDYATPGTGGTNIAALLCLTDGTADSIDNHFPYAGPVEIETLYVPRVQDDPLLPEQHWTHYSLYRTEDLSENGVTPRIGPNGEVLPPLKFTWMRDLRIGAAFLASKTSSGYVTIHVGELEYGDEGTPFKWENGEVDIIGQYVDSLHFWATPYGAPLDYYYDQPINRKAAVIGDGRVFRCTQSGHLVTRLGGDFFTAADVGKTITWAIGYYSIITEYIDADHVLVHDSIDKDEQGCTLDINCRDFTDLVPDETLRDRQGEKHIGLLDHRFWVNMPNINILEIVPGFMVTAIRDFLDAADIDYAYCVVNYVNE